MIILPVETNATGILFKKIWGYPYVGRCKMELVEKYINSLMDESTPDRPVWNIEKIRAGKKSSWDYIDGSMILALLEFYKVRGDKKFFDFCENYVDYRIEEDGTINGYDIKAWNLDNINAGKNLLTLYTLTEKEKYRLAADKIYEQIKGQPRTKEGNFWHKAIYPDQVWLDGLYMVMPFYAGYANLFLSKEEKEKAYADIYRQFFNVEKIMKDPKTGLYYHCYDSSKEMYWCDMKTGLCENFWLRALGWFGMAMLDTIDLLEDKESEDHKHLQKMFTEFIGAVVKVQTDSGMWYQLPAFPGREKNYLETSGSSIFSYCILKGIRLGLIPAGYEENGKRAFIDICSRYLTEKDGRMGLGGICLVAGLERQEETVPMTITCQSPSLKTMQRERHLLFLHILK